MIDLLIDCNFPIDLNSIFANCRMSQPRHGGETDSAACDIYAKRLFLLTQTACDRGGRRFSTGQQKYVANL